MSILPPFAHPHVGATQIKES